MKKNKYYGKYKILLLLFKLVDREVLYLKKNLVTGIYIRYMRISSYRNVNINNNTSTLPH